MRYVGNKNSRDVKQIVITYAPGLSLNPPLLLLSWQQQSIYLIRPSREYKLPAEEDGATGADPGEYRDGPSRQA